MRTPENNWLSVLVGQEQSLTIICDNLLSILILGGFIADQHKVPLMAVGAAQVIHQVRAILQTSVPLSRKSTLILFLLSQLHPGYYTTASLFEVVS